MLSVVAQKIPGNQFILKGKITNSKSPIIYLIYDMNGKRIKDSCELKQESFYFKGNINEPTWAFLRGNSKIMDDAENPNIVDFFLEPTTMTATVQYDHFKEIKITGSKTQLEYEMLQKQYDLIDKNSDSLYEKFSNLNQKFIIINHPNSYVSAFKLWAYKTRWTIDSVESFYTKLTPSIQNSSYGKEVKKVIDEIENNSEGNPAKAFKTIDINENTLSLSGFKGKYVLLDFWGSWCVPCRQGMPHLIDLFNRYHNEGFDVIAIAEEYTQTKVPWKEAVKKDGTGIWHNVLSGLRFNTDGTIDESQSIKKLFGVHVFPTKILIDKTGIIIGRYTGTEEESNLDKKLSEIFKH
jgi:thiol-disulfide isomerase/thioredoxin